MIAPICLFTYTRLVECKQTIEALKKNYLANDSNLYIFSDGAKDEATKDNVKKVRKYIKQIEGFKSVQIIESETNKGLANSIITGVSEIVRKYGKVIVLEDDLITSPNFLNFMNQALDFYSNQEKIFSISGYSMDLPSLKNYDVDYYLGYRASSWGWGTWLDRWEEIDWKVTNYKKFIYNPLEHLKFMRGGSDLPYMLWKQMNGKIDSWAIRWCFHQYKNNLYTVFPTKSKIMNIGFGESATHTLKKSDRFHSVLEKGEQKVFQFENEAKIEKIIAQQFRQRFSVFTRLKYKFA